jgi:hypothetical protein
MSKPISILQKSRSGIYIAFLCLGSVSLQSPIQNNRNIYRISHRVDHPSEISSEIILGIEYFS